MGTTRPGLAMQLLEGSVQLEKQALRASTQGFLERGVRGLVSRVGRVPGKASGWGSQVASAVASPIKTVRRGWGGLATGQLAQRASGLAHSKGTGFSGEGWKKMMAMGAKNPHELARLQATFQSTQPGQAKRLLGLLGPSKGAGHLLGKSQTLRKAWGSGGAKGAAEELSRRGWTGQGGVTKYLPGGKATLAAGGVQTARAALKKPTAQEQEAGVTRGGKAGTRLGYMGSQLLLSATPMGMAGGLVAGRALSKGTSAAGAGVSDVYRRARGLQSAKEQGRQLQQQRLQRQQVGG